ncbi:MAG: M42 family metallopeptidase [Phycisphaerales bacterium]|nr:M42 family metallopeptidase [Phycisphaerales bacterium]
MSATDFGPFELLRRLTETPGVSGREERVRDLVLDLTRDFWDETRIDSMGNLICLKRAARPVKGAGGARGRTKAAGNAEARPPRVMLACHMDEIGFYVRYIDDSGFLRLQNVGGFDTRNLFARRVVVHGRQDLPGVLNPVGKPIHIATDEERKKVPQIGEFCVDLFLPKSTVVKHVEIGDPVTLEQRAALIGPGISAKALDNRISLWVAINAIRRAFGHDYLMPPDCPLAAPTRGARKATATGRAGKGTGSPYDIYFVACVQEEVGLRGATTAAYGIDPDIGIAIDTTLACDTPGVSKDDAVTEFGKGVAIKLMDGSSISHRGLFDEFVTLAARHKIPFQREILPRGGTDAGAVQRTRAGTRAITLSVPTRYIHTVTETIHRDDAFAAVNLLAAWLEN